MQWAYVFVFVQLAATILAKSIIRNPTNTNATANLGKPSLSSGLPMGTLDHYWKALFYLRDGFDSLPVPGATARRWAPGSLPVVCQRPTMPQPGLNVSDIEVYDITYDDCIVPWVLCRHKDSPSPLKGLVHTFGQVPVRARQHVRHVNVMPNTDGSIWDGYDQAATIVLFDNNDVNIQVMLHETGHSLDAYGGYGPVGSTLFSKSETWHNAVAQDPKVPSNYSNTNYMEDLAETTVIAFYDVNVPGGVKQVQKGWQDIFTQFNTVKERLGDTLKPGGSCSSRPTNSVVVRVDDTKTPDKKPSVYAVKVVSG